MPDQVEKVTEQRTTDGAGQQVTTRAVSTETRDAKVNKAAQVVWFIFGVLTALLLLRVVLSLMGANTENSFASFIYTVTNPFVSPFRGLLQQGEFQAGISRFEFETLVAAAIYLLLGWGIATAISLSKKNTEL